MPGHMSRNHPGTPDALNVLASPGGMQELERFSLQPIIAATMRTVTLEDIIGSGDAEKPSGARQIRPMAATMQTTREYSPKRVSRKEIGTGGKPSSEELREKLAPIPTQGVTATARGDISRVTERRAATEREELASAQPGAGVTETTRRIESRVTGRRLASARRREETPRRGVRRRQEPTSREYGWETIRQQNGVEMQTTAPRWVTKETFVEYRGGVIVARGETARYEY
jgi:hypothetical protein